MIDQANEIIEVYQGDGYDLSLRQLYYQFVSRDAQLIRDEIEGLRDEDALAEVKEREEEAKKTVRSIAKNWDRVLQFLQDEELAG